MELRQMQNELQAQIDAATARQQVLNNVAFFVHGLVEQGFKVPVEIWGETIMISIFPDGDDRGHWERFQSPLGEVINRFVQPAKPSEPVSYADLAADDARRDAQIDALIEVCDQDNDGTMGDAPIAMFEVGANFVAAAEDFGRNLAQVAPAVIAMLALDVAVAPVDDGQIAHPTRVASPRPVAPQPAPRQVAPKRTPPLPQHLIPSAEKSVEWTPGMVARLRDMRARGLSIAEIAKNLGRDSKAVENKWYKLLAAGRATQLEAAPKKAHPANPPQQNSLAHRLDRLEGSKLWPMALNLQLAVHAKAKKKMPEIATLLGGGLTQEDVSAQLLALCPNRARIGAIDELVEALRQRVET